MTPTPMTVTKNLRPTGQPWALFPLALAGLMLLAACTPGGSTDIDAGFEIVNTQPTDPSPASTPSSSTTAATPVAAEPAQERSPTPATTDSVGARITSAEEAGAYMVDYYEGLGRYFGKLASGTDDYDLFAELSMDRDQSLFANPAAEDALRRYSCYEAGFEKVKLYGDPDRGRVSAEATEVEEVRPGLWIVTVLWRIAEETPKLEENVVTSNGHFITFSDDGGDDDDTEHRGYEHCGYQEISPAGEAVLAEVEAFIEATRP